MGGPQSKADRDRIRQKAAQRSPRLPKMARINARLRDAAPDMFVALQMAQKALAMMTEPNAIGTTSVQHAWAQAVEAEGKCRAALSKASPSEGGEA